MLQQLMKMTQGDSVWYIKPIVSLGTTTPPTETAILGESDGTLKISNYGKVSTTLTALALDDNGEQFVSLVGNVSDTPTKVELESSGELKGVGYGKTSGGTITPLLTESTGELNVILNGKDSDGPNIDAILTNDNRAVFVEIWNHYITKDPQVLAASEADLWDPAASGVVYEVEFRLCNTDASARTVTIGVELGSSGGLQPLGTWLDAVSLDASAIYPSGDSNWVGPFVVQGDDAVRGFASAADVVNIQWRIKQVNRI